MSRYTTELRYICEHACGLNESASASSSTEIISKSRGFIFDSSYPIFDESYRATLEEKIIGHYYMDEIGCETVGLWKFYLNQKMREIMPYYNQLYKSELIEFNPLYDTDLNTEHELERTGENDGTSSGNDTGTTSGTSETVTHTDTGNEKDGTENTVDSRITKSYENSNNLTDTDMTDDRGGKDTFVNGKITTDEFNDTEQTTLASGKTTTYNNLRDATQHGHKIDGENLFSDTPQGGLSQVRNANYLTDARITTEEHSGTDTATRTGSVTEKGDGSSDTLKHTGSITHKNTGEDVQNYASNVHTHGSVDVDGYKDGNVEDEGTTNTITSSTDNGTVDTTSTTTTSGNTENTTTGNTHEDIHSLEQYAQHVLGKSSGTSYSSLLKQFRDTFLNIDMMIIDDLSELFMLVY